MGNGNLLHPDRYLSDEVINEILIRLPIKDAVRTSVLSRNWRFQWQKMSKLVFDIGCLPLLGNQQTELVQQKLPRIISRVLSRHVGSVESFVLLASEPIYLNIDKWIFILQRKLIKEITLSFSYLLPFYTVPSCLFNCHQLVHLELCGCKLRPSLCVTKLSNLKSLHLSTIFDDGGRIEALISNCPSLEVLSLEFISGPDNLKLFAPRLQSLIIKYVVFDVTIYDAPSVNYLTFHLLRPCRGTRMRHLQIAKILNCLTALKELHLTCASLRYLCHIRGSLHMNHECLERLVVEIDLSDAKGIAALLCLFRSFPNIKSLDMQAKSYETGDASVSCLSGLKETAITFHQLRKVRVVSNMVGAQLELPLIKYILANAPALQALELSTNPAKRLLDNPQIIMEIMRFPRASPLAEIIPKEKTAVFHRNYDRPGMS